MVEVPYDDNVPLDDGTSIFGDLEFKTTKKDGVLSIHDTVVNQNSDTNVSILYSRTIEGYYVEDLVVFNVGRQRAFVLSGEIRHDEGYAEAQILVPAGQTVRVFVEIYVSNYCDIC